MPNLRDFFFAPWNRLGWQRTKIEQLQALIGLSDKIQEPVFLLNLATLDSTGPRKEGCWKPENMLYLTAYSSLLNTAFGLVPKNFRGDPTRLWWVPKASMIRKWGELGSYSWNQMLIKQPSLSPLCSWKEYLAFLPQSLDSHSWSRGILMAKENESSW